MGIFAIFILGIWDFFLQNNERDMGYWDPLPFQGLSNIVFKTTSTLLFVVWVNMHLKLCSGKKLTHFTSTLKYELTT